MNSTSYSSARGRLASKMAEKTKNGDFVEIEYTGVVKDGNTVFDTTDDVVAKKEGFYDSKHKYGPKIVCLGQNQLIKGLDDFAVGKDVGTEYEVLIQPENGFGKKDAKLMKLVPTKIFTKDNIRPVPGLPVNIDGMYGVIRAVAGGRIIVDFNHPLSGKELIYKFKINRIITDDKEKLTAFLSMELGVKNEDVELLNGSAKVKIRTKMPDEFAKVIEKKVLEIIPSIKKVDFIEEKKQQNA
jgi:FKBP-type peptidyl-prolyl cis-trans isomerase 2